jgi:RimJ/RimL family protein N-acetyltransferase
MRRRAEWTTDDDLMSLMGANPAEEPLMSQQVEERRNIEWLRERRRAGDRLYAIEFTGRYVGDVDVEFFPGTHNAEMTVLIGERSARGRGCGTETVRLIMKELQKQEGVENVQVDVAGGNDRALHFWRNLGFRQHGTDGGGRSWLRSTFRGKREE